jgi:VanZ family protein
MPRADRIARVVALVAWMAMITYWSGQPQLPIDHPSVANILNGWQHRVAHLIGFSVLGLLARWTLDGAPRAALLAVLLASAFGATDEYHQSFTPGRRAAVDDWLVDTASATVAVYLWWRLRPRLRPALAAVERLRTALF